MAYGVGTDGGKCQKFQPFRSSRKIKKYLYSFRQNETDNFGIVTAERATLYVNDYMGGAAIGRITEDFLLPFRKPP